jgi:serine/threonine protein kinase
VSSDLSKPSLSEASRDRASNSGIIESSRAPATHHATRSLLERLSVGVVIDGKYRVDQIIGRGAMGVVVAATHQHLKERVALKFLHARRNAAAGDFHSRFQREAQVSAKLRNEHITRVIDVGVWQDDAPFMVMDHLAGVDLRQALKAHGRLPVDLALEYIVQVCEGVAEAHAHGIVHRDLKPSNLFVTKRADGSDLIKILDFGISKWSAQEADFDELTQAGVVLGSPKYMAPEQLFGSATVDTRADVWSIGAIFYELLTGRPPFDCPTLQRMVAELATDRPPPRLRDAGVDVPEALEEALARCFAREREARVQNVAELASSLLDAVDAPFAEAVRQKIQAMLEPGTMKEALRASSGARALGTGSYQALATSIMSASSGAMRAPQTPPPAADIPVIAEEPARPSRITLAVGGALAAGMLLLAVVMLSRGATSAAGATASAPPRSETPLTATATSASAITAPAAPTIATSATSATSAIAPEKPAPHAPSPAHVYRAAPKPSPAAAPPPAPSAIAAPPTPPPPPAAPPPAASPKSKPNPLEDRQ